MFCVRKAPVRRLGSLHNKTSANSAIRGKYAVFVFSVHPSAAWLSFSISLQFIPGGFSGAAILYSAPFFYLFCTYFRPNVLAKHIITHLFGFFNVKMHKLSIKIPSFSLKIIKFLLPLDKLKICGII